MTPVISHQVLQEEIQQYAETKKNLRRNIKVLRDTVRKNPSLPIIYIFLKKISLILLFPYTYLKLKGSS